MLRVGITGGIGSGKTTVCKMFEKMGVPVYYADDQAKWLMQENTTLIAALKKAFGAEVYLENGQINRSYLSQLVFNNKKQLDLLNSLVHPIVFQDAENWQKEQAKAGFRYSLKEAALLFESGSYKVLDKIIVVTAPEKLRIERVMNRDQASRAQVLARIHSQMPQLEKEAKADFLIQNTNLETTRLTVAVVHQQLLNI